MIYRTRYDVYFRMIPYNPYVRTPFGCISYDCMYFCTLYSSLWGHFMCLCIRLLYDVYFLHLVQPLG